MIKPFEPLPKQDRDALNKEGERTIRFIGDGAEPFEVRFVKKI